VTYGVDYEACYQYINETNDRFTNKGIGLLAYNGLIVAATATPEDLGGASLLALASSLTVIVFYVRVLWGKRPMYRLAENDFTDFADILPRRAFALTIGVWLPWVATLVLFITKLVLFIPKVLTAVF
jgi:hypothetical protein